MFLDSFRPAIDSGLSVSRIGSNAQCKLMKVVSVGIKNLLTNYRLAESLTSNEVARLLSLNVMFFQDHLFNSPLESSLFLLLLFRNGFLFNSLGGIHRLLFILSFDSLYLYYIPFTSKTSYDLYLYSLFVWFFRTLSL